MLLLVFLSVGDALADSRAFKQPYYTLDFKAVRLGVDIRLNDARVVTIDSAQNTHSEIPVNEYIINGRNEIKITTFPYFSHKHKQTTDYLDSSKITVGLYVRENGDPEKKRVLVSEAEIKPKKAYARKNVSGAVVINKNSPDYKQSDIKIDARTRLLSYPIYSTYNKQVVFSWHTTALKAPFLLFE